MNKKLFTIGLVLLLALHLTIALAIRIIDIGLENDQQLVHNVSARPIAPTTPQPSATETPAVAAGMMPTRQSSLEQASAPSPDAPACTIHDPLAWHGLWDPERGCHYAHTHNADPTQLDSIFGSTGALYGGQTISYPWQTPRENELKHEGYKWELRPVHECTTNYRNDNCIGAFRILFHVVGLLGANVRNHSFWVEAEVCDRTGATCGTAKSGGWADFGILCVPYKGEHVPLAELDPDGLPRLSDGSVNCDPPPYRGHFPHETVRARQNKFTYTWNSSSRYGYNQIVEYDFQSRDDFGGVNTADPTELNFACPDFTCSSNHSTMLVYEIVIEVPRELDDDDDGLVTYSGFSDRFGKIVEACQPLGPDCIPLEFDAVPVGWASFRVPLRPETPHSEYDIYFCGDAVCDAGHPDATPAGWIQYPN